MKWLSDASIQGKLLISFGLTTLMLLAVGVIAFLGMQTVLGSQTKLYETDFVNATNLITLEASHNAARAAHLGMIVITDAADRKVRLKNYEEYSEECNELLDKLLKRNAADADMVKELQQIKDTREQMRTLFEDQVVPMLTSAKPGDPKMEAIQVEVSDLHRKVRPLIDKMGKQAEKNAETAVKASTSTATGLLWTIGVVGAIAVVINIALVMLLNKIIAAPLNNVSSAALRIAAGNLGGAKLSNGRLDEIGQLGKAFNNMLDSLRDLTGQTRTATENINAAAAEILASTQQQAASTREQSATVHEITSTMQEISQSGAQISEKAKQVATAAEATSAASNAGLKAVQETNRTMEAVREQVEEVAENIVALSEKTQAVGEIIASVNDIAEQSNLLALNATIEAAAAGEHGSRFSVVANEMKNLADQAKQATVQVRTILGDIQKGINSSVMLTEEAVKRAESGKQQAEVTDGTIRSMAQSTMESVQAFQQIIGSTNQQQIGLDQVTQGMQDIRQAAEQTASGTGQLEKAVSNLNALSHQLRQALGRYQL